MSLIEFFASGFVLVHTVSLGGLLSIGRTFFPLGELFSPWEILLKYAPVALRSPRGACEGTYLQVVL